MDSQATTIRCRSNMNGRAVPTPYEGRSNRQEMLRLGRWISAGHSVDGCKRPSAVRCVQYYRNTQEHRDTKRSAFVYSAGILAMQMVMLCGCGRSFEVAVSIPGVMGARSCRSLTRRDNAR